MIALLLAALFGWTEPAIRLEVSPRVSVAPVPSLHLRVWIIADDDTRALVVAGVSEVFERSSAFTLDGAKARRIHDLWWTRVPCGHYDFTAATLDQGGRIRQQTRERAEFCPQPEGW